MGTHLVLLVRGEFEVVGYVVEVKDTRSMSSVSFSLVTRTQSYTNSPAPPGMRSGNWCSAFCAPYTHTRIRLPALVERSHLRSPRASLFRSAGVGLDFHGHLFDLEEGF